MVIEAASGLTCPSLGDIQLFCNCIRPLDALQGKTPADFAGIQVQGENKWLELLMASLATEVEPN